MAARNFVSHRQRAVLFICAVAASTCREGAVKDPPVNAEPLPTAAVTSATTTTLSSPAVPSDPKPPSNSGAAPPEGQADDSVTIDVAGTKVRITLTDAEAMRLSLWQRLTESKLPDRDALLKSLEHAAPYITADGLRIGAWQLGTNFDQELVLTYRVHRSDVAILAYTAVVVREGATWIVRAVHSQIVHARR